MRPSVSRGGALIAKSEDAAAVDTLQPLQSGFQGGNP